MSFKLFQGIKRKGLFIMLFGISLVFSSIFFHQQGVFDKGSVLFLFGWFVAAIGFFVNAQRVRSELKKRKNGSN